MSTLLYLKNFIKDKKVASVTPTSGFTIKKICKHIDFEKDIRVLEYGPGDGVFTKAMLQKMTPGSEIIAIETNREFSTELKKIKDRRLTVVNRSAEYVEEIMASKKWNSVHYIISGIPFSFLDEETKHRILELSVQYIAAGGKFLAYQTSLHLKPYLEKHFTRVDIKKEYRNIPPMCLYIAKNQAGV